MAQGQAAACLAEPPMSNELTNAPLERRIAAALTDDVWSADLSTLIAETEAAIVDADKAVEEEREAALDPVACPDAAAEREAMQAAEFARERLRKVLPRLQARLTVVGEAEEFADWLPQREEAKARRDLLATRLGELYRPFIEAIIPLLLEIEKADQEIWRVNQAAPVKARTTGGYLLHSVEEEAGGPSAQQLRHLQILKHLRLPNWDGGELPVWPPHRPPNATVIVPTYVGDPRLSSDHEVKEEQEETLTNYHNP